MGGDAFLCGGLAGAVGSFATQPLDTIRIKMQTMAAPRRPAAPSSGTMSFLGAVLQREGALGLYKGVLAPVAAAGPRSACIFAGYDVALRLRGGCGLGDHALAGAAGGLLAAPVTNSMELVKCRAQVSKSCSSSSVAGVEMQIFSRLWRQEGLRGLACGLPLTLAREVLYRAIYFGAYEATARTLDAGSRPGGRRKLHTSLLAGGLAGVVAWLPVYPVDVIKTHWQTGRRFNSTTILGLLRNGLVAEGPQWLARGLAPTLVRTWPLNAIVFTLYERLQAMRR
mmetsp:Transcript_98463/g.287137  ORF Transcript_98463/g.287137 Transcript_98463/m.287137 type:complete len:282 (-) Transcript_98463:119-964(-)